MYKEISEEYKLLQTWEIGYPDGNGLSAEPHIQNQRYTKQLLQYYFIQKKVLTSGLINFSFTSCYEQVSSWSMSFKNEIQHSVQTIRIKYVGHSYQKEN